MQATAIGVALYLTNPMHHSVYDIRRILGVGFITFLCSIAGVFAVVKVDIYYFIIMPMTAVVLLMMMILRLTQGQGKLTVVMHIHR